MVGDLRSHCQMNHLKQLPRSVDSLCKNICDYVVSKLGPFHHNQCTAQSSEAIIIYYTCKIEATNHLI